MAASRLSKFQGSLVGAVVGDCIGGVFEGGWFLCVNMDKIKKCVQDIDEGYARKIQNQDQNDDDLNSYGDERKCRKIYTDDTAMAKNVAKSLIKEKKFDAKDLAKRFTEEYMENCNRGYGVHIVNVFEILAKTNYSDVFGPAKQQFDGRGSYGNGGAMRIAPAALFAVKKGMEFEEMMELVENITVLTHTHFQAVQGAILQCYAVHQALLADTLDVDAYIDTLLDKMRRLEEGTKDQWQQMVAEKAKEKPKLRQGLVDPLPTPDQPTCPYSHKLEKIREMVHREEQPSIQEVRDELGVFISALESVPAAIYFFLRGMKGIKGIEGRNEYERTIMYSISHGADTDTVATMAGAIAGAYYGLDRIPKSWQWCAEGVTDSLKDAEQMYKLPEGLINKACCK